MSVGVLDRVRKWSAACGYDASFSFGTLVVLVPRDALSGCVEGLKADYGFDLFLDVTAVDWPEREPRFDVVYHFYSTTDRVRVRLKVAVPENDPNVPSLTPLYGAAHFMERECHEMYGIGFTGNPDLRPILLYEGFEGHPLRKEYPKDREQPLVDYRK